MSRTYRIRKLPVLLGTARKFPEGIGYKARSLAEEAKWSYIAHKVLKLPCLIGSPHIKDMGRSWRCKSSHRDCVSQCDGASWAMMASLSNYVEQECIYSVSSMHCHPWISGGVGVRQYYRTVANRQARHKTKQMLHTLVDYDSTILPVMDDFYDRWRFS